MEPAPDLSPSLALDSAGRCRCRPRPPAGGVAGRAVPAGRQPGTARAPTSASGRRPASRVPGVPVRRARRPRHRVRSGRADLPHLARLPARHQPGSALRLPDRTARTIPARGRRYNPAKLLIDPYARAIEGDFVDDPACYARQRPGLRAVRAPLGGGARRRLSVGQRPAAEHAVGRHDHLRAARAAVSPPGTRTSRPTCAAPTPGWPTRPRSPTSRSWASPRWSCCRSTTSSASPPCSSAA